MVILPSLLWAAFVHADPATPALPPAELNVFIAGIVEWKHPEQWDPFPPGRKDMQLAALFQRKGVTPDRLVHLADGEAESSRVKETLSALLSRSDDKDTLFLYLSGHGWLAPNGMVYFITYDAGTDLDRSAISVPALFDLIESRFQGRQAIIAGDFCHSGALVDEAKKRGGRVSYGVLASANTQAVSTPEWTFTNSLLRGLRGDPVVDVDGDGAVRFEEVGGFIQIQMAESARAPKRTGPRQPSSSTGQSHAPGAVWATTGRFDRGMKLADVTQR